MRWLIVVGCALVLAVTGGGPSSVSLARESSSYALLQMNLCLSGFARCYGKVAYPAGVQEAVARIRDAHPDAVTLNETCQADVAQIARRTGYHLRFSTVTVAGTPLACVRPGGRGHFGDAVLTKAAIESSDSHDFKARLRPGACLDPDRRFGRPGPGAPVHLRERRAPLALGSGAAGQAHRPRLPPRPRTPHPRLSA